MYHLFVSGNDEAWQGAPWQLEISRFREYTSEGLIERYGAFTQTQISEFRRFPCIFAYENGCRQNPKFGLIRDVVVRQGEIRIEYELLPLEPFLTYQQIDNLKFELDIGRWELNRTHWAIKDVDLARELNRLQVQLPDWARGTRPTVDIENHQFEVALSFPGEARALVESIGGALEGLLGPHSYFYDNNYTAQLARPNLDTLLQDIYGRRSKLIVVFLGSDYQRKEWCGIELRAIRQILMERGHQRIMFVRLDDGEVEGVFKTDGYVDARHHNANALAEFIRERAELIRNN